VNPFFSRSTLEYELPDFASIKEDHYKEAFYEGTKEQLAEVDAIIASGEPTFENTIVALEKSGRTLTRMLLVFYNKSSSDTNDNLDAIEEEIAPKLSAHQDAITLNPALFGRIKSLHDKKGSLALSSEDSWLLDKYYRDFVYAGAHLTQEQREELSKLNERLSFLETQFSKNLLADTNDSALIVDTKEELAGLSDGEIQAAADAASARGLDGKYLLAMVNFTGNPMLESLEVRATRERIMKASLLRGNRGNEFDTKKIITEMAKLRATRAKLFGKKTHAEYIIAEQTAGSVANVHAMLRKIAPAAARNARAEGSDIQAMIKDSGQDFELASWDWDYYTEKVRKAKHNIDSSAMRPYFELERVLHDGVFFAANKLFGISFKERPDLITYHPEARAFEVFNEDGSKLGLFIGDFYTRDSKRGGAWPSQVNEMWILWPEVVANYAKHHETGEQLPQELIDRLKGASTFNEGHATTSYLAAAILDLAWHSLEDGQDVADAVAFEAEAIKDYGLDYHAVPTRYRSTYFSHIFGGGYSAGYYGYIWSEVLDAESVDWFKENGGLTRKNGDHFRAELLSRGGSIDSMQMFKNFRGREASITPLLKRRGLE